MKIKLIQVVDDREHETICAVPHKTIPDTEVLEILKEHFIITSKDVDNAERVFSDQESRFDGLEFRIFELSHGGRILVRIEDTVVRGV